VPWLPLTSALGPLGINLKRGGEQMGKMKDIRWFKFKFILVVLLATVIGGCATIKLVADYDEKIDAGVTELHKQTEEFFIKLESTAKEDSDKVEAYTSNKKFYKDAKLKISTIRLRADATQRNSLTVRMLDKLLENINRIESDHKEGITKAELPAYRGGLTSQFTAILTFELAKKRGQKADEKAATTPATKTK
jgi:hypothetical protein